MPPFTGTVARTAVDDTAGDDAGADARSEEHNGRVLGPAAAAEPHLGLAQRLGAVAEEEAHAVRESDGLAQQRLQRYGVPADGLTVDDRAAGPAPVEDAGDPDADAEQALGGHRALPQHSGDAVGDMADDQGHVVAVVRQRAFRTGEFGHGDVEEFDPDPGLADIHTDQSAARRGHPEQGARPAAVGFDHSGLLQQSFVGEFGDHVADGA